MTDEEKKRVFQIHSARFALITPLTDLRIQFKARPIWEPYGAWFWRAGGRSVRTHRLLSLRSGRRDSTPSMLKQPGWFATSAGGLRLAG